jgi:hypothetical protein
MCSCTLYVQLRRIQVAHATAAFFTRPALLIRAVAPYAIDRLRALAAIAIAIAMHTSAVVRRVLLSTLHQCSEMADYPIASTIAALHRMVAMLNESPAGPLSAVGLSTHCPLKGPAGAEEAAHVRRLRALSARVHGMQSLKRCSRTWPCMQRATHTCTCHTACSAHLSYGMQRTPVIRHAAHTW